MRFLLHRDRVAVIPATRSRQTPMVVRCADLSGQGFQRATVIPATPTVIPVARARML